MSGLGWGQPTFPFITLFPCGRIFSSQRRSGTQHANMPIEQTIDWIEYSLESKLVYLGLGFR
jgi:hypothetical protein